MFRSRFEVKYHLLVETPLHDSGIGDYNFCVKWKLFWLLKCFQSIKRLILGGRCEVKRL
jgi:hypothetical protein